MSLGPGPLGLDGAVGGGLLSALGWGVGDFSGGLASRRAPVFGVTAIVVTSGVPIALVAALLVGEAPPSLADAAWAAASGAFAAFGILMMYTALAGGRMAIVAPVSAVLAAGLPAVAGALFEGMPGPVRTAGILLALGAIVLVSRAEGEAAARDGLWLGLGAGATLGIASVLVSGISPGHVWTTIAIARLADGLVILLLVALLARPWRVPRAALPLVAVVAATDLAGNVGFFAGAAAGRLDVVAVLGGLYPAVTVGLAFALLGERIGRGQLVGVALAFAAILLIALG